MKQYLADADRYVGLAEDATEGDPLDHAWQLNQQAYAYSQQGNYAAAEPLLQRALAIREKVLGPEHPNTVATLKNYAVLLREMGRVAEADALLARAGLRRRRRRKAVRGRDPQPAKRRSKSASPEQA